MKLRISKDAKTGEASYWLWCPGCDEAVRITDAWRFDGNLEEPTFEPSILTRGHSSVCHSFLRQGQWEFLSDSTHHLAGKKAPAVDLPNWLASE